MLYKSYVLAAGVMKPMLEIVHFIRTRALNHRQFRSLLEEMEEPGIGQSSDVTLHCSVRWLSRGKVVRRFLELLDPIKVFLSQKEKVFAELESTEWLLRASFLSDILDHLNRLNLSLQGRSQTILDLSQGVFSFMAKLQLFQRQLGAGDCSHFVKLRETIARKHADGEFEKLKQTFADKLGNLCSHFQDRFTDLQEKKEATGFLADPFLPVGESLQQLCQDPAAAELEMLEFQEDARLRAVHRSSGVVDFWKVVPEQQYPNMKGAALRLLSMFGTTYICESLFSTMNQVKFRYRSSLSDVHLSENLRLATTGQMPRIQRLVAKKDCQKSH